MILQKNETWCIDKLIAGDYNVVTSVEVKKLLAVIGLLLLVGMLVLSLVMPIGCEGGISSEARSYLSKMQAFDEIWGELYWSASHDINSDVYDELTSAIIALKPPSESISYNKNDFYLPQEHSKYVEAMQSYVSAERNLQSILALLKLSCEQRLRDPFWRQLYVDVSDCIYSDDSYKNANHLAMEAHSTFEIVRYEWESIFREYFPERY